MAQDKVHLLMEETGCDQQQAELAMALAGYDLEKAIRAIGAQLRHIVAMKGRFLDPAKNLYGLVFAIADARRASLVRLRAVVSYNPALYEVSPASDWFDFERSLYASRLAEGTLQHISQELERALAESLDAEREAFLRHATAEDAEGLGPFLHAAVAAALAASPALEAEFAREMINLDQYRRIPLPAEERSVQSPSAPSAQAMRLEVQLVAAADGVAAEDIRPGDSAACRVTDGREIAQYLSRLLGAYEGSARPFFAPVEEAQPGVGGVRIVLRLSTGITGSTEITSGSRWRIERAAPERRWYSFFTKQS